MAQTTGRTHFARVLAERVMATETSSQLTCQAPARGMRTTAAAYAAIGLPTLGDTGLKLNSSKYTSVGAAEGVSVFDMKKAMDTLKNGPDDVARRRAHPAAVLHAERLARAQQMGATLWGFKLFPDLTPGRAFMWGTVLAVYAVGFTTVMACRSLEIGSVGDIKPKVQAYLAPYKVQMHETANRAREAVEVKEQLAIIGHLHSVGQSVRRTLGGTPAMLELDVVR